MARRDLTQSAAPASNRVCPVCGQFDTYGIYQGRQTLRGRRVDQSECVCFECGAAWHEAYYVRSHETRHSNIRPRGAFADVTALLARPNSAPCPICASPRVNVIFLGDAKTRARCSCDQCRASWIETYRGGQTHRSSLTKGIR